MSVTDYVGAPMRNEPEFGFKVLYSVAKRLRELGHIVLNPAENDRELGFDPNGPPPSPALIRQMLAWDLDSICRLANRLVISNGEVNSWWMSEGVGLEHRLARFLQRAGVPMQIVYPNASDAEQVRAMELVEKLARVTGWKAILACCLRRQENDDEIRQLDMDDAEKMVLTHSQGGEQHGNEEANANH